MHSLEIKNLHVAVEGKEIVKGVSLVVRSGEVHALMGPNGSGKSTLANAIMGHSHYTVTDGKIFMDGRDITTEKTHIRAKAGVFLSMQYPPSVIGLNIAQFLRTAYQELTGLKISVQEFHKKIKTSMSLLGMNIGFLKRGLNEGFSGGEKKRMEILQMLVLEPKIAILDETDSGLDIDALKSVAQGIGVMREKGLGVVLITHYARFLEYLTPDFVHVMSDGKIIREGGPEVAGEVEEHGYEGKRKNKEI